MPNEVFSTDVVECRGRKKTGKDLWHYKAALRRPVQALITTFKDGTRDVCCPHASKGNPVCKVALQEGEYPNCSYANRS